MAQATTGQLDILLASPEDVFKNRESDLPAADIQQTLVRTSNLMARLFYHVHIHAALSPDHDTQPSCKGCA
jgi:hypothetical protein